MYPQGHCVISGSMLEQMLQLPSAPMPHLLTSMDGSSSRSWKPNIEVAPNCPRCSSTNTKFCYYNNYSLSQPRYFCKGCRRYWTKGGSLRKVPIGGGCRKNRRGKSSRHQPQSEHHSLNNVNSSACDDREYSSSLVGGETNNGCSDIDMALVFAKFLNQNPNPGEEFESEANNGSSCSNNASTTSLTPESVEAENDAVMQPQKKPSDLPNFDADDAMLIGEVPRIENSVREELSFSGIDELDGFLGEDVVQDVLWSYDDATMSSSVNNSWQPPMMQMQLQELEHSMLPFNEDSQLLPISSTINLLSDSWSTWSSFDVPTMEVFSSTL